MRILFVLLFSSGAFFAYSQQPSLRKFAKVKRENDSIQSQILTKIAREANVPLQFVDSIGKRNFLLIPSDGKSFSYLATLNAGAAQTTGATVLQDETKGFHLTGEGIVAGVWDDGLVKDHVEFDKRILSKEGVSAFNHATHVTGTILASGVNASAKGMAPQAKAYTYDFGNDLTEMISLASEDETGLLFSNHSYGTVTGWSKPNGVWTWYGNSSISTEEDYLHGFYNQRTKDADALAYLSPYYTIVWAAGNDRFETGDGTHPADCNKGAGYDCIIPEAVAKNIITVGAVSKVLNYTSPGSITMSHYSSWGPTDDGRIKPDIVSAGTDVFSTLATGENTYGSFTGTSMATPSVTGSLMLLQELHADLNGGHYMKAATLKALAIHTAKEAGPKAGPDYQFGWGLLDVKSAADLLVSVNEKETRVIESSLTNGATYQFEILPAANKKITLTLCWTDPEGNPATPSLDPLDRMLVNDLDIRLIDETGVITSPWILNPSVPQAQAIQGDNSRDNVEKIEFDTPLQRKYTVLVRHKGQLKNDKQDFSLILTYKDSASPSSVFYWVGQSGGWNDITHWSLASGGPVADRMPGENDIVIVDEQSLLDEDTIEVTQDATVSKIVWLNSKQTVLNLQGNTLQINSQLIVSHPSMHAIGGGRLHFSSSETGFVNVTENNLSAVDMFFESGTWKIDGSFKINDIQISGGSHTWVSKDIEANSVRVESMAAWDISSVNLTLRESLQLPVADFQFNAVGSTISIVEGMVEMNWQGHKYQGKIRIELGASLTLRGDNAISSMEANGAVEVLGTFEWDSVSLLKDAVLKLSDNTDQRINTFFGIHTSSQVRIEANTGATITLQQHKKLCFENVRVKNVSLFGNSVVNLGVSSVIENSSNWLQMICEEVLFADFTMDYPCANGLVQFKDDSQGNATSWKWVFEKGSSTEQSSEEQNPTHYFENSGLQEVVLTIKNATQSNSFSAEVMIQDNALPMNEVVLNNEGKLMSVSTATTYQWYNNKIVIEGAEERTFDHLNQPGMYEVLTQQGGCNRLSEAYVITELEARRTDITIFPNPASSTFTVEMSLTQFESQALLMDIQGRFVRYIDTGMPMQTTSLADGIYIVQVRQPSGQIISKKIIIAH